MLRSVCELLAALLSIFSLIHKRNIMSNFNSQVFTELTSDQASIVEGGLSLTIHSVHCLKADADSFFAGSDDLFITADGSFVAGTFSMKSGRKRTVNCTFNSSRNTIAVDLFDDDQATVFDQNDYLGGFTASSTGGQIFSKRVSGSGSRYRVFYSAV